MRGLPLLVAAAALMLVSPAGAYGPNGRTASASIPALYKNCTALNKKYPHGLGRASARDKTTGTPVTTFKRSDKLYHLAMSYNKRLDRDKDGIACERL